MAAMPGRNSRARSSGTVELEIVKRTDKDGGFKVLRRRWVIERTSAILLAAPSIRANQQAFVGPQHAE